MRTERASFKPGQAIARVTALGGSSASLSAPSSGAGWASAPPSAASSNPRPAVLTHPPPPGSSNTGSGTLPGPSARNSAMVGTRAAGTPTAFKSRFGARRRAAGERGAQLLAQVLEIPRHHEAAVGRVELLEVERARIFAKRIELESLDELPELS